MEYKLRAISNNISNDNTGIHTISETTNDEQTNYSSRQRLCDRSVPVLFSTNRGLHLRKYNRNMPNNYTINFCDLERFNLKANNTDTVGIAPQSNSSDSGTSSNSFGKSFIVKEINPHKTFTDGIG